MMLSLSPSAGTRAAHALLLATVLLSAVPTSAQNAASSSVPLIQVTDDESVAKNVPVIAGPTDTPVGRTVILDASESKVVGSDAQYLWFVEGAREPISRTVSAIYTPEKEGIVRIRLVIRSQVSGDVVEAETVHTVVAYRRKLLLIADTSVTDETLAFYTKAAKDAGTYVKVLRPVVTTGRNEDEALRTLLREQRSDIEGANVTILWTNGFTSLQSLMEVSRSQQGNPFTMQSHAIAVVTEGNLHTMARTARGPFTVMKPDRIIFLRPEGLSLLFTTNSVTDFIGQAETRSLDYTVVDAQSSQVRPWNVLSVLVNYMFTKGISSQTIILLLMLPVIATILSFLKQVVGMTTFGLFAPSIIALSFMALGWSVGVLFLLFIVITGYATRAAMKSWHLLYIPKMAIILTVGSITLLLLLGIGSAFNILFTRDTVFILLIMSTLSESFLTAKTEGGWLSAVSAIGQTVVAALLCVVVVSWPYFQSLVLAYPELILLTVLINVLLGRFTGLRITEYFRFREVFRHLAEEE